MDELFKEGNTYHMAIVVSYPRRLHEAGQDITGLLCTRDGHPCSPEEILSHCDWLASQGFECIPACDDTDEKGRCKGHES